MTTQLLNDLTTSVTDIEFCRNERLLTDLMCLVVYPPCIPDNRAQLAICNESCTVVSTFISDCIINDGFDNQNSSNTDYILAMVTNLTCSENSSSHFIPEAAVNKSQCIQLETGIIILI